MTDAIPEAWVSVPGYAGLYEVSSWGTVRSLPHEVRSRGGKRTTKGRILKAPPNQRGYPRVTLLKDGVRKVTPVHQIVAAAFLGPCPDGMEIRHGDGNPANSTASNLSYGTKSENCLDSVFHGTHRNARKTHCDHGHPLIPGNLVRTRSAHRRCLTCSREQRLRKSA